MSSDANYASFLDQANQDTGGSGGGVSAKSTQMNTKAVDTDVPASLKSVDGYYMSETDEPFEPVSLKWDQKSLPTKEDLQSLVGAKGDVFIISLKQWDPDSRYGDMVEAIKKAADDAGDVKVYKIEHDKTRLQYYVLSLDAKHSRLVGLKMKAVES